MGADNKTGVTRIAGIVGLLALLTHGAAAQTVTSTDIAQELQRQIEQWVREIVRTDSGVRYATAPCVPSARCKS